MKVIPFNASRKAANYPKPVGVRPLDPNVRARYTMINFRTAFDEFPETSTGCRRDKHWILKDHVHITDIFSAANMASDLAKDNEASRELMKIAMYLAEEGCFWYCVGSLPNHLIGYVCNLTTNVFPGAEDPEMQEQFDRYYFGGSMRGSSGWLDEWMANKEREIDLM